MSADTELAAALREQLTPRRARDMAVTRLTANRFTGKRFWLDAAGEIASTSAASIARWDARTAAVPTAEALADLIRGLTPREALCLSCGPSDAFRIEPEGTRRTADNLKHAEGPGWLLLDHDRKGMPQAVADRLAEMGGAQAALETLVPGLGQAARVWRPSSSAGVHRIGRKPSDHAGFHSFVAIQDQRDSQAYLDAIAARCWAAGVGWIVVSASGALLDRTIVDTSVWTSNRLVFCAPPELGPGLVRTASAPVATEGELLALPVAPDARDLILAAQREAAPEGHRVHRQWRKRHIRRAIAKGAAPREAIRAVRERTEGGLLHDHDTIELNDGSTTTVGALLDRTDLPERFALPCPLEGIGYGASKATLLRGGNREPVIVSHAHGWQKIFRFSRYAAPVGRPAPPSGLVTASEARAALAGAVDAFFERGDCFARGFEDAAPSVLAVGAGLGKSRAAVQAVRPFLNRVREIDGAQWAVVYAVPDHLLGAQVAADLRATGLSVAHLRGPEAQHPAEERLMCIRAARWIKLQKLLLDPTRACQGCALFGRCDYLAQGAAIADVYVVAHAALAAIAPTSTNTRKRVGQRLAALIVDENAMGARVFSGADRVRIDLAKLDAAPENPSLRAFGWRARLRELHEAAGNGPLTREALDACEPWLLGWGAEAREAIRTEWARKQDDLPEAVANETILPAVRLWQALADFAAADHPVSGRIERTDRGFALSGVRRLGPGYDAPVLILDATHRPEASQALWGEPAAATSVQAHDALARWQDATKSGSKSQLLAGERASESARRASQNWRFKLRRWILRKASGRRALVVSYKQLIAELQLPAEIATAHFGSLRGRNDWQDRDLLVIVGRPLASSTDVQGLASALLDRPAGPLLIGQPGERLIEHNGEARLVPAPVLGGDPGVADLAAAIRDDEILQAVARLRAVNRPGERLECLILSDAQLDRPVRLAPLWDEVAAPSPLQRQADAGPVALSSPGHAAAAYPGLWRTASTAKTAWAASGLTGTETSIISIYDETVPVAPEPGSPEPAFDEPGGTGLTGVKTSIILCNDEITPVAPETGSPETGPDWVQMLNKEYSIEVLHPVAPEPGSPEPAFDEPVWPAPGHGDAPAETRTATDGRPWVLSYRVPRRAERFVAFVDPARTDPETALLAAVPQATAIEILRRPKRLTFAQGTAEWPKGHGRTYRPVAHQDGGFGRVLWASPVRHKPSAKAAASQAAFVDGLATALNRTQPKGKTK